MSFVKKMLGQRAISDSSQSSQDSNLGLMHLRKLFTEFRHPQLKPSQKNQEEKLYSMLPLFIKVFENTQSSEMTDKWSDILQFCSHVSKLMVTEIRRRASNQSTEAASCAIVQLLEMESQVENENGWMLLTAINLLSLGGNTLIDCMTAASLPSTLVKCLYLFFDLPPIENDDKLLPGCQFTPKEKRILLQKIFVQVLVRLCNHTSPAEELARKDDLSLLFSAITSWCPKHNIMWRQSAGEVLVTLSRHGLTPHVVNYIHEKGCVRHCIENMQRAQDLSPLELVEMFVTVFCFLKDSSEVSQLLLDDFRSCQGYVFLSEFLLKLELDLAEESIQALRNLVLLVGSLTTCGFSEMKPSYSNTGSLFQMPGFIIPSPSGKGVSVRNLQAFQVLQSVFLKSSTSHLCSTILDVISSIYHQDNANYFILETQHTLSQFAEKIYLKPEDIQIKFFEMLEFLVFNLNFVPCKELISVSILIKSQHSIECSILCMKSMLRILRYHSVYRDVFREVGMLEVMVTCLHRYAALLKEQSSSTESVPIEEEQQELGLLVMEALSVLLSGNGANAGVFRECGGARCAHNMVPFPECRQQSLHIVQQLVLSPGGDDDMGTLLGLMPTASVTDLELKTHILKSLLNVLRESHRTRTVFRKVGGFVYVMSVLVSMEGCLSDPPKAPWDSVEKKEVLVMLKTVFSTLTVAMRYEPANAKFFATEVRYDSLTEAVRLLGCFSNTVDIPTASDGVVLSDLLECFGAVFIHSKEEKAPASIPKILLSACIILRYLYDMALDAFDKPNQIKPADSPCLKKHTSVIEESQASPQAHSSNMRPKSGSTGSLLINFSSGGSDSIIIHSGAILSIFHLLPAIEVEDYLQASWDLKIFIADLLKSLVRNERNQQIMCDARFPHELLSHGSAALADESHPLHTYMQYMFERLASQSLTSRDLRDFLRLGSPLSCRSVEEEDIEDQSLAITDPDGMSSSLDLEEKPATVETEKKLNSAGGTVPLTRVKCLVSMTTPRDSRMHGSSVTPAFVEFDMSAEGFSCLYLPSIAPQGPPTPSVVGGVVGTSEPVVIGGIGTGERVFPPQSGLTYSTWFCVDKFSTFGLDAHPVRLLTIVRNLQGREENLICLSVSIMSKDRALIVTTQENYMPNAGNGCEIEQEPPLNDNTVRFWCPELTQEGQWHHLVLVLHRAGIMKNSNISLFVDGELMSPQKLHYISPNLGGGGTASPTAFTSVFAYIGTPPQLRRQSRLLWRQGPCFMLEDIVTASIVKNLYQLGPTYVGSLQAPIAEDGEVSAPYIGEERVMFGVFAHAMSQMTIAKIRKVYNKVDSKSIAKQLAMSAHENATPIRIIHNSAAHLAGSARSLGAVLMGYLGVRTFCPQPVARMLDNVGGTSVLLGLIAMAKDVESLYAAVKALVCVVRSNNSSKWDMDRIHGYQLLAMLYKKKRNLLNSHILHLTFSLVGTLDSGRESSTIPNISAFQDLLCDLEIWHEAPGDLQRSLYEHFYELLTDSSELKTNQSIMKSMDLTTKLLHILKDPRLPIPTVQSVGNVLGEILAGPSDHSGLLRFGQHLVSTFPVASFSEKNVDIQNQKMDGTTESEQSNGLTDCSLPQMVHNINMRNILLDVILKLVKPQNNCAGVNLQTCDDIAKRLGYDWLLLFMQSHIHSSSVVLALRILLVMFRNNDNVKRFREGSYGGGWMGGTELVLKNQMSVMLGFNVGAHTRNENEINHEVCHVPGFQALQWLLSKHNDVPDVYYLLMALLLGQQNRSLMMNGQPLNVDAVWTVIFGVSSSKPMHILSREAIDLCPDAALVLLAMIRCMINEMDSSSLPSSIENDYPVTVIQFLMFLYHNLSEFQSVCSSSDFVTALVATLFPTSIGDIDSDVTTPNEEFKPFPESDSLVVVKLPNKECSGFLTGHPVRRLIIDFIRTIVIDSLSQMPSGKSASVLDLVLDATPEHASRAQQKEFQTEMLKILMDHLLAADILLGDQAALPLMSGSSYSHMATNVFYFASRVVDKMWHGVFTREPQDVFDFLSKLISQAKRKSTGISLDPIYKCLNRTILFQLSRPIDSLASQASVLDALHLLTNNRNLIFGPGNHDNEFLGCLCYCLLQLTEDPESSGANLSETKPRTTTWHVNPEMTQGIDILGTQSEGLDSKSGTFNPDLKQGMHLVSSAAKRVWDELYVFKKPALEELFRTQLNNSAPSKTIVSPDINAVRLLIQESASKIWVSYAENERKSSFLQIEKLQNQIQSKLQKVGSGVSGVLRLASRKSKKDLPLKSSPISNVHVNDFLQATISHVVLVKNVVLFQHEQYLQTQKHFEKYLLDDWKQVEKELLRVRSLWGPQTGSKLDKMVLDVTEGPFRMRKKMMKNDVFYVHYPYRPNLEDSPLKYKVAISNDSKKYYEHFWPQGILCKEEVPIQKTSDVDLMNNCTDYSNSSPDDVNSLKKLLPKAKGFKSVGDDDDTDDLNNPDLERLEETAERSENTVEHSESEGQGDSQNDTSLDVPSSPTTKADNQTILHFIGEKERISHMFRCARIQGLDTAEGLLLFGKEHFYVIDGFTLLRTKEIKDIDSLPYEIHDPIIPKSTMGTGSYLKRMYSRFAYDDIREVHKRRYLLQPIAIEVFSGDGRNHLLAFPRKIRNKVMTKFLSVATAMTDNAQHSVSGQRQNAKVETGGGIISNLIGEKSVTQRWEKGEISNFQYLMHLNTLAGRSYNDLMQYPVFPWIIANYDAEELDLSKASNFRDLSKPMGAQTPVRLQQFQKRYNEWDDPQGETPPYHYGTHYSSAMIVASYLVRMEPFTQHFLKLQGGHFDLADRMFHSVKENWLSASKNNMADVKELIPEFFYLPDFLLNKNNFDLGVKQNGVSLGDVLLPPWAKGDPREFIRVHRQALECDYVSAHLHEWIDLIFGYKQCGQPAVEAVNVFHHLFYEGNVDIYSIDDPLKKNATIGFINNFGQIPKQLFKRPHPQKRNNIPINTLFFHHVDNLKPTMQPIKELKGAVGQIHHLDKYLLAVEQNKVLISPGHTRYLAWGFSDLSIRIGSYESEKTILVFEGLDNGEILCASCPNDKIFITGGTSCVVNVWEYSNKERKATLKQPLYGHTEPVTCLTSSAAYSLIVSGSRDKTCILWDLSRLVYVHQLRGHVAPVAAVAINELTGDIATCAGTFLHVWNVNGEAIASVNTSTGRNQQIFCVCFSQMNEWDIQNVVLTGSSDGVVRMWSVEYVQVPKEPTTFAKDSTDGSKDESVSPNSRASNKKSRHSSYEGYMGRRKLSRHESCDSYSDGKPAVDMLKDFKDPDFLATRDCDLGSSEEQDSPFAKRLRDEDSDASWDKRKSGFDFTMSATSSSSELYKGSEDVSDRAETDSSCVKPGSHSVDTDSDMADQGRRELMSQTSGYDETCSEAGLEVTDPKPSTASTEGDKVFSHSESSEVETSETNAKKTTNTAIEDMKKYKPIGKHSLREGFCWQRQLVFRSKLTMHTAFERKDNKEPAAVTAIALSRDHKTVYVGDIKGRIWNWTVTSQPGRVVADHWIKDDGAESCPTCGVKFSFSERKHHCRNCGNVFCSKCSCFETEIKRLRILKPVRVCQACYNIVKAQQASML
ncbi:WD repeat and FYVE domain-containing protein 3-like isoform X2 [Physella acuta]|uniref:WD repeat and FYVE domain-containing protein 3-like isoform X2 n=1 Tax=Physella acuta TaxID=109671 RepID=UPI0027DE56F3|nr:WD repeat and FYVE domain-containing protein 3-like isoform X2 [Physella acuta]